MARRRDLDERGDLGAALAAGVEAPPSAQRRGRAHRFWEEAGGLDLAAGQLLPGGQVIQLRFRRGACVEAPLATLGFSGPALFATLDAERRGVVLALPGAKLVDLSAAFLLGAVDPEFREAQRRAAEAPAPVGALIRARRRAAGYTAAQVAAALGMAPSNYARLEASRHQPRLDTLRRVAAALGIDVGALLDRTG